MEAWCLAVIVPFWLAAGSPHARPPKPAPDVLRRPGETTLFAFVTRGGKTVSLCEGPRSAYLVYRFGTAAKVELQYPAVLDESSWHKFTYAAAHLGVGAANAGGEFYQLTFKKENVLYMLDDLTYIALDKHDAIRYRREVNVSVSMHDKTLSIAGKVATAYGDLRLEDERLAQVPAGEWL